MAIIIREINDTTGVVSERTIQGKFSDLAFTGDWKDILNKPSIAPPTVPSPVTATTFTITVKDAETIRKFTRDCRITIPLVSSVYKPTPGTTFTFLNIGTGVLNFVTGHSSIVVHSKKDARKITEKSGVATLLVLADNEYLLAGDLTV